MNNIFKFHFQNQFLYLIYFLFPLQILVSTISNYTLTSYILKGLVSLVLLALIIYINYKSSLHLLPKKLIIFFALIIIVPLFSLIYSPNSYFGLLKILNLIITFIPVTVCLHTIVQHYDRNIFQNVLNTYSVIGALSVSMISVFDLFDYAHAYSFSLTRWSHVIYGRFISTLGLITLLTYVQYKTRINLFFFVIFLVGTILSGFRAGAVALVILATLVIILYSDKKIKILSLVSLIIIFLSVSIFISGNINERYSVLINLISGNDYLDGAINTRLTSWKLSVYNFIKNPIIGIGFGGFNQPYINESVGIQINYPHNIILETAVELGIIGLLLLGYNIYKIFKNSLETNKILVWYFLFALILALTSKDLTTNTMFFCGLGLSRKLNK